MTDEPFGSQPLQALPYRRPADFQPDGEIGLHQALVGTQVAAHDGRALALVDPVGEAGRRGGAPRRRPRDIRHGRAFC
jgi:hypothetical protein